MLHLLTEEHRQKIVKEYRKRILIVSLMGLAAIIFISAVLLLPTFIISYGKYSEIRSRLAIVESELGAKNTDTSVADLRDISDSISALNLFANQKPILPIIEGIVVAKPDGIALRGLVFTPSQAVSAEIPVAPLVIDLSGVAKTRKDLVAFQEKMKLDTFFSSVTVPLSNFAKDKDITFSMKLIVSTTTKAYES